MIMCRPVDRAGQRYTEAEVELVFNATVPLNEIPPADGVVGTLRDAVNNPNPNVTFNLTVDANSIVVTRM